MIIIYKTINLITNMIYIGVHSKDNPKYLGSGKLIKRAVKKYGKENFIRETLEEVTEETWQEKEKYWIAFYNSTDRSIGYNITLGGYGVLGMKGTVHHLYGTTLTEEHKSKIRESSKGRIVSDETRKKCSDSRKCEKHHMFGKKHSEEYKMKMSEATKGKIVSKETRQKMSEWQRGVNNNKYNENISEETRLKRNLYKENYKNKKICNNVILNTLDINMNICIFTPIVNVWSL